MYPYVFNFIFILLHYKLSATHTISAYRGERVRSPAWTCSFNSLQSKISKLVFVKVYLLLLGYLLIRIVDAKSCLAILYCIFLYGIVCKFVNLK